MKRIIAVVILAVMVAVLGFAGPAQAAEYTHYAYLTGYTYWDNTPPGTAAISHPVIHTQAAGTGTFNDPITLAVGHSMASGNDVIDISPGIKFYMVSLQKYFIVEDTCGDGPHPENGPCHTNVDEPGYPQYDMWIDGKNAPSDARARSNWCAEFHTGIHKVIKYPANNYVVRTGPVMGTTCAKAYGETPIKVS